MAATGWFWDSIDRRIDTQIDGGVVWTRNNWKLSRHRRSNAALSLSLRDTETSLTGNNGGVDETIDAPSVVALSFAFETETIFRFTVANTNISQVGTIFKDYGDTKNGAPVYRCIGGLDTFISYDGAGTWDFRPYTATYSSIYYTATGTANSFPAELTWVAGPDKESWMNLPVFTDTSFVPTNWGTAADRWIESGYYHNGYPIYIPYNKINTEYPQKLNAAWYSETGATNGKWCIAPIDPADVSADSFSDEASTANYPDAWAVADAADVAIDGLNFSGAGSWDSADGEASFGTTTMFFICTADVPSYPNKYTDYYMQTQEWIYQDNWVRTV